MHALQHLPSTGRCYYRPYVYVERVRYLFLYGHRRSVVVLCVSVAVLVCGHYIMTYGHDILRYVHNAAAG